MTTLLPWLAVYRFASLQIVAASSRIYGTLQAWEEMKWTLFSMWTGKIKAVVDKFTIVKQMIYGYSGGQWVNTLTAKSKEIEVP